MANIESLLIQLGDWAWGPWLVALLLGGGGYFLWISRGRCYHFLPLALKLLKRSERNAEGDWSHAQALAAALSGTVGMGNITGVAVAISVGGPGAIFWMWISAFIGMTTKFFTATLAVAFRGRDDRGHIQGGPMYVITTALPPRWHFLAYFFAWAGMLGCIPMLQANQLVQIVREQILLPNQLISGETGTLVADAVMALAIVMLVGAVILGGVKRIGRVTLRLVPFMALLYIACGFWVVMVNIEAVPDAIRLIFYDAFTGQAVAGGALGSLILTGIRRGTFSNEAGIGTEVLAHGAARSRHPVDEGAVAMLGPVIDTLILCTTTAVIILVTGVWRDTELDGISMTTAAFESAMPGVGRYMMVTCVIFFAVSTLISYAYYGQKCFAFLFGTARQKWYVFAYLMIVFLTALVSVRAAIGLSDAAFAMMAIPTMISTILLAHKVPKMMAEYYFWRSQRERSQDPSQ